MPRSESPRRPSDEKTPTLKSQNPSLAEVVAEWVCRFALVFRDAASLPTQITAATVAAYVEFLDGCDPALLARAMRRVGEQAKFFPRPQQIRDAYQLELENKMRGRSMRCEGCEGAGYVLRNGVLERCVRCSSLPGEGGK